MRLLKKKLTGFVGDNPNYRWEGYYMVKYKGMWIIGRWMRYVSKTWSWLLADGTTISCDDEFDDIDERRLKNF
jgi:hypothetical protein